MAKSERPAAGGANMAKSERPAAGGANMAKSERPAAEGTREALIEAGLRLFGEKGFDATSTRDLAAAANANIGSIAYHFGGKDGLRSACAGAIVDRLSTIVLAAGNLSGHPPAPDVAADRLETAIRTMVTFMIANPQAEPIAAFIQREMAQPSPALDRIYAELIEPTHKALCTLWAAATGRDPESAQTRIDVFAVLGQALYFRIGRPVVIRRMAWRTIGEAEASLILATVTANLRAQIAARRTDRT